MSLDAVALAFEVADLLKNLIEYGREVKGAREKITGLCLELSSLRGVLENVKSHQPGIVAADDGIAELLKTAGEIVDHLSRHIQPLTSRLERGMQALQWPFKQKEIEQILARLGRINMSVLMTIIGGQQSLSPDLQVVKDEVRGIASKLSTSIALETRKEIVAYLAPTSPSLVHGKACTVWERNASGTWFVQNFVHPWLADSQSHKRVMALHGSSGTGKTTIMSRAVEHVKTQETGFAMAYFYCSFNDNASREWRNILGSWFVQLAAMRPTALDQFHTAVNKADSIPISSLETAIADTATSLGPTVLVLDALNESRDDLDIAAGVTRLASQCKTVRFLLSSTSSLWAGFGIDPITVPMAVESVEQDIEHYVRRAVQASPVLLRSGEENIVGVVVPQANGVFRWAECQMSFLSKCLTANLVKKALKELPGSLDETYINTLARVPKFAAPWVREALMWLNYAYRPLTLDELAEAIVVEVGQPCIDDDCRIKPPHQLLGLFYGLVAHNPATNTVTLAHSSIGVTLESAALRDSPAAGFWMTRSMATSLIIKKSLSYLLMDEFDRADCSWGKLRQYFHDYPFLDYASNMWAVHARESTRNGETFQAEESKMMFALFATTSTHGSGQHFFFWIRAIYQAYNLDVDTPTPLYYASSYGLTTIVEFMLINGMVNFDDSSQTRHIDWKSGGYDSTPLQVAAYRGHTDVVELLLRFGADPNSVDSAGISTLQWAIVNKHWRVVEQLRKYGAHDGFSDRLYGLHCEGQQRHAPGEPSSGDPLDSVTGAEDDSIEDEAMSTRKSSGDAARRSDMSALK